MKGVSPLVAMVVLIAVVFATAAIVGPFIINLATRSSTNVGNDTDTSILCQRAAYDFLTSYGNGTGVNWSFSGSQGQDYLLVGIRNSGPVTLHSFSLEATVDAATGQNILQLGVTNESQRTGENPLRPGQGAILNASITSDITGSLRSVKVLNGIRCPAISTDI
ncbi:MAG: hypothetical protein HY367_01895 [Candidatus Aenigmarchaeota archaeon]|nr:hypothetical protein [Candidatus Aenigmarchaeota archaeon]